MYFVLMDHNLGKWTEKQFLYIIHLMKLLTESVYDKFILNQNNYLGVRSQLLHYYGLT